MQYKQIQHSPHVFPDISYDTTRDTAKPGGKVLISFEIIRLRILKSAVSSSVFILSKFPSASRQSYKEANLLYMKPSLNCNLNMPYPEIKCTEKNLRTALMLNAPFAGPHGELTAILTYVRQNIIYAEENNTIAAIFECIALTEMRHFHQLGKLIHMLGGNIQIGEEGRRHFRPFSGSYIDSFDSETLFRALQRDIRAEKEAAAAYQALADEIEDPYIKAVLLRIRADEMHHAGLLDGLVQDMNALSEQRGMPNRRSRRK